jgi:hypothetical protein
MMNLASMPFADETVARGARRRMMRLAALAAFAATIGCGPTLWQQPPLFPVNTDSTSLGSVELRLVSGRQLRLTHAFLARDSLFGLLEADEQQSRVAYARADIRARAVVGPWLMWVMSAAAVAAGLAVGYHLLNMFISPWSKSL